MTRPSISRRAIIALALLASAAFFACSESSNDGSIAVHIGALTVRAEVARTAEQRSQGLSGRDSLAEDAGMLFTNGEVRTPSIWMKNTRFPLDLIFISSDLRVTEVIANVPAPEPGTPDADLPSYRPADPGLYFLEVNAGIAAQFGVSPGDAVDFEPEP